MTHRVHPKAFRIKELTDWDSRGFYQKKFPANLEEDFKIREFLGKKLSKNDGFRLKKIRSAWQAYCNFVNNFRGGRAKGRAEDTWA